jgi:3-demethoxyubiquinol 3-hydroxylase
MCAYTVGMNGAALTSTGGAPNPTNWARRYTLADRLIAPLDQVLRTLFATTASARPYPAEGVAETVDSAADRREAVALMRVNHAGEVAAQALYQGQATVAGSTATRASLMEAADEETDHLAWCARRIEELGGRTSLLNPLWYAGSFAIGALAGLSGDRTSLGFVAETERQVVEHLEGHLHRLPRADARTRAIIQQMSDDEERHGRNALNAGGAQLPAIVGRMMRITARVMTRTAYWL